MMRTVSNLTRRRKAKRLQDGIDRYVPISRQDGWTITRSVTTSPGPRLPTASAVDRCKGLRSHTTPCRPLRRWQSTSPPPPQGARECRRAHRRTTTGRLGRLKLKCERRSERRLIPIYRSLPSYNRFVAWYLVRSQCLAYRVQDRSPQLLAKTECRLRTT